MPRTRTPGKKIDSSESVNPFPKDQSFHIIFNYIDLVEMIPLVRYKQEDPGMCPFRSSLVRAKSFHMGENAGG